MIIKDALILDTIDIIIMYLLYIIKFSHYFIILNINVKFFHDFFILVNSMHYCMFSLNLFLLIMLIIGLDMLFNDIKFQLLGLYEIYCIDNVRINDLLFSCLYICLYEKEIYL